MPQNVDSARTKQSISYITFKIRLYPTSTKIFPRRTRDIIACANDISDGWFLMCKRYLRYMPETANVQIKHMQKISCLSNISIWYFLELSGTQRTTSCKYLCRMYLRRLSYHTKYVARISLKWYWRDVASCERCDLMSRQICGLRMGDSIKLQLIQSTYVEL